MPICLCRKDKLAFSVGVAHGLFYSGANAETETKESVEAMRKNIHINNNKTKNRR